MAELFFLSSLVRMNGQTAPEKSSMGEDPPIVAPTCQNPSSHETQNTDQIPCTHQEQRNFRDALRLGSVSLDKMNSNSNSLPIPQKQVSKTDNGLPKISLSEEEILNYSTDFQFTLVGKFSYGYPALHTIKKEFLKLQLMGDYFVGILNVRHIIIKLSNEADYLKV